MRDARSLPLKAATATGSRQAPAATFVGDDAEAPWRAAAGTFAQENFDAIAAGTQLTTLPGLGISFGFLNDGVSHPAVQNPSTGFGGLTQSSPHNLSNAILVTDPEPGRGPIEIFPLVPGTGIGALGYWNTGQKETTLRFFDAGGNLIEESPSSLSFNRLNFNGIVSDTPAARVQIARSEEGFLAVGFSLDNLQVSIVPVPEPASLCLVVSGLVGLSALVRRARQRGTPTP